MTFRLFDLPAREPSQFVGFAGNDIDRDAENRTDESVAAALADGRVRMLLFAGAKLLLKVRHELFMPWFDRGEAEAHLANLGDAILLGTDSLGPVLAATSGLSPDAPPDGLRALELRPIYVNRLIDEATLGAVAQAGGLINWHRTHRFCSRCGGETAMRIGGYKRVCGKCAAEHFPRTDPVAIMLAVTRTRCLLGRSPHFPPGMYSALAGFIEPGETIENAVRRETFEESGIRLGRVAYHASQPWPFPMSLMIGCFGEALNEDVAFDGKELQDCRWFTRQETRAILAGTHPDGIACPPPAAIAHHLIRAWAEADG
jgi:NAD+ diphosphatase